MQGTEPGCPCLPVRIIVLCQLMIQTVNRKHSLEQSCAEVTGQNLPAADQILERLANSLVMHLHNLSVMTANASMTGSTCRL